MPRWMILPLLLLAGCQAAQEVDSALRRVDVLDRVFAPRPPPAPVQPAMPLGMPKGPEPPPEPEPEPPVPVLAEPVPEPEPPPPQAAPATPAERLRRNPWITRFWSELTPAQQARIARRLPGPNPAGSWDPMGLADRLRLVFGA